MITTVGQVLVNEALPPKFRDYERVMDSDGIESVLRRIATEDPGSYAEVSKRLMEIGAAASFDTGTTIRLSDLTPAYDKRPILQAIDAAEAKIRSDPTLTDAQKSEMVEKLYDNANSRIMDETLASEMARRNQLALQVASKARGNKVQLASFVSTPGTYSDPSGKMVPMFIRHSYAEGLSPAEYWAGSFGARAGVISTKSATAKGGAFGKLLSASAIAQVITEEDCGTDSGLPVKVDDDDNIGAVLARPAAGYDAGTVITKSVLSDLRKDKRHDEIVVRSPATCGCKDGVCSKCAGIRETGGFPPIGYNLGTNAASAFAERIAQGALNFKHCLSEGTLVRMADWSVKPIEEIKVGDMVMGSDRNGHVSPVIVTDTFDNGFEPCIRTTFRKLRCRSDFNDISIDSTSSHKILASYGDKPTPLMSSGKSPVKIGSKAKVFIAESVTSFDDTGLMDEPFARILGMLIGNGCYTKSVNGVHLSSSDQLEIKELNEYLLPMNLRINKLKYHDGYYHRISMIRADSKDKKGNPLKNYLIKSGMYGKFAHEKDVPDVAFRWSNKSVADLLGGFIATDGSVCEASNGAAMIAIASTSLKLIRSIQDLLLSRFGIQSSSITRTGKAGAEINAVEKEYGIYYRKHDQYQFMISGNAMLERVLENIHIPGSKRAKLEAIVEKARSSGKEFQYNRGYRRISQEDIGIRHVYDIHVNNEDHLFLLANGLIVSNSGKKMRGAGKYQGFEMFTSLAKVPKVFPDRATLAEVDGTVTKIEEAPQGGTYIYVTADRGGEEKRHYVAPGYDLDVKEGDTVEAGDQMSDGVIDPSELVKYKGIGEGRRYWASRFTQAIRDSGMKGNRRNAEVLARTVMNTVKLNSEDAAGDGLPGDVTTYTSWSFGFKPRQGSAVVAPTVASVGKYLEQPVLHYTIGTRVTPSVIKTLKKFKVQQMMVNDTEPDVTPFMERIEDSNAEKPDWVARLGTTYLKSRLQEDVARGAESRLHSTEPYPGLAKGVEFGDWGQPLSKNRSEHFTY